VTPYRHSPYDAKSPFFALRAIRLTRRQPTNGIVPGVRVIERRAQMIFPSGKFSGEGTYGRAAAQKPSMPSPLVSPFASSKIEK
jgi:hypothetical protein